jgi:uncharacterized protein YkwD
VCAFSLVPGAASAVNFTAVLDLHNKLRAIHGAAPLTWSARLSNTAQAWAKQCTLSHSHNEFGENLAWGTKGAYTATFFVQAWYDEVVHYDYARGEAKDGDVIGHFTQLVWAGSTRVGCGLAQCGEWDYLVCNYSPPGNYVGEYTANVLPPRK